MPNVALSFDVYLAVVMLCSGAAHAFFSPLLRGLGSSDLDLAVYYIMDTGLLKGTRILSLISENAYRVTHPGLTGTC